MAWLDCWRHREQLETMGFCAHCVIRIIAREIEHPSLAVTSDPEKYRVFVNSTHQTRHVLSNVRNLERVRKYREKHPEIEQNAPLNQR